MIMSDHIPVLFVTAHRVGPNFFFAVRDGTKKDAEQDRWSLTSNIQGDHGNHPIPAMNYIQVS